MVEASDFKENLRNSKLCLKLSCVQLYVCTYGDKNANFAAVFDQ